MGLENDLQNRSEGKCELCSSDRADIAYLLPQSDGSSLNHHVWICSTCKDQLDDISTADENHWRCLNDSIWSETPAVQVLSWRMLTQLSAYDWARDLLDIAYLDEATMEWAKAGIADTAAPADKHTDCYGAVLEKGDSVVLVKTLDVKGATFSAKLGTVVRNIRLVEDNTEQIEGKVNGSQIVILTKYVRKSNPKE